MSIQFSGLVSGLNSSDIISRLLSVERRPVDAMRTKVSNINNELNVLGDIGGKLTALNASIKSFTDARLSETYNVFNGRTAKSSNATAVGASASASASAGNFTVEVTQLATKTKASSGFDIGKGISMSTRLNEIYGATINSGNFTYYKDSQQYSVAVNAATDTLQNVSDRIFAQSGSSFFISGSILAASGGEFAFGASSDSTNFTQVFGLNSGTQQTPTTFTGSVYRNTLKVNASILGGGANIQVQDLGIITPQAGTFSINGTNFTLDSSTTLNSLINSINSSTTANVKASFDPQGFRLTLESKKTGSDAIALNENGTKIFQLLGLSLNDGNTLFTQTLGKNAQFSINGGATQISQSNSVDSTISGLQGVTLNLLANTTGTPTTITVAQDSNNILAKAKDFVAKFNDLIDTIDSQTAKDQALAGNSSVKRLKSQLLSAVTGTGKLETGQSSLQGAFQTLASIGISTGAASGSIVSGQAPSRKLVIDEASFLDKLNSSPDDVRRAFIGNQIFSNSGIPGFTPQSGVLNVLDSLVTAANDPISGVVSSRTTSANSQITSINKSIQKGEDRLVIFQKNLQRQYSNLEQLISKYQSQGSSLASIG